MFELGSNQGNSEETNLIYTLILRPESFPGKKKKSLKMVMEKKSSPADSPLTLGTGELIFFFCWIFFSFSFSGNLRFFLFRDDSISETAPLISFLFLCFFLCLPGTCWNEGRGQNKQMASQGPTCKSPNMRCSSVGFSRKNPRRGIRIISFFF